MNRLKPVAGPEPAIQRLGRLAQLDGCALAALTAAVDAATPLRVRKEIVTEGHRILEPMLLVSGWAAQVRLLHDGRRQFLSFLLPGDLIGLCHQPDPIATSTVTALTDVTLCVAPAPDLSPALAAAYAMSDALAQAYLLEQVARLGRFNALERITSLLLELHERLNLSGAARGNSFDVPFTQEVLADALGLTSVHVNRMLQLSRRNGDLHWHSGTVTLPDPIGLADWLGRRPVRVSASQNAFG